MRGWAVDPRDSRSEPHAQAYTGCLKGWCLLANDYCWTTSQSGGPSQTCDPLATVDLSTQLMNVNDVGMSGPNHVHSPDFQSVLVRGSRSAFQRPDLFKGPLANGWLASKRAYTYARHDEIKFSTNNFGAWERSALLAMITVGRQTGALSRPLDRQENRGVRCSQPSGI